MFSSIHEADAKLEVRPHIEDQFGFQILIIIIIT